MVEEYLIWKLMYESKIIYKVVVTFHFFFFIYLGINGGWT